MASRIKILDKSVSSIIAAGEVIENPAALVKELIENSLDALATEITLEIKDGGRYIKISDNGIGMDEGDLILSIEKHATSKISEKEDIYNLGTYGFRGEALSSIASISKLRITSKTEDMEAGTSIYVENGDVMTKEEVAMLCGTKIEVSELFHNIPARLKFLRSDNSEYLKIKDIVLKEALVNYKVKFTLIIDGKETLKTSGVSAENTILELFGNAALRSLIPFELGYFGDLNFTKNSKNYIYTYFNKRYAKSPTVDKAILDAYYTKLMKGKYPFSILFMEIDPREIDVNVHPSKKMVKFSNEGQIYKQVYNAFMQAFSINERKVTSLSAIDDKQETSVYENEYASDKQEIAKEQFTKTVKDESWTARNASRNIDFGFKQNYDKKEEPSYYRKDKVVNRAELFDINMIENDKEGELDNYFNKNKLLGQLNNMYILVETADKLEIYDQHIVHERVLYENIKSEYENKKIATQGLLVPIIFDVDILEKDIVNANLELLENFGFEIEEFGSKEMLIRKVPVFDFRVSMQSLIKSLISDIAQQVTDKSSIQESVIISMSCKGAVKAGEKLTEQEMKRLINELHKHGKYTCPHGRNIIVDISFNELEKKFKRKL